MSETTTRAWGAQSMTAPLREVLVKAPGAAFGRAFDDPAVGFLRPVDLDRARREHDGLVETLTRLGSTVHVLDAETDDPDLVYVFDPLLVADGGAIPLRPGKPNRAGEPDVLEAWTRARGIPTLGPDRGAGHARGRRHVLAPAGPAVHRADAAHQRRRRPAAGGDRRRRRADLRRPVLEGARRARPPALGRSRRWRTTWRSCSCRCCPPGCYALLADLGIRLVEVPEEEYPTLGCNVLAVRPGVVVVAEGNAVTRRRLEAAGCEVHAIPLGEVGENGSGGVTCLTRPVLRG